MRRWLLLFLLPTAACFPAISGSYFHPRYPGGKERGAICHGSMGVTQSVEFGLPGQVQIRASVAEEDKERFVWLSISSSEGRELDFISSVAELRLKNGEQRTAELFWEKRPSSGDSPPRADGRPPFLSGVAHVKLPDEFAQDFELRLPDLRVGGVAQPIQPIRFEYNSFGFYILPFNC